MNKYVPAPVKAVVLTPSVLNYIEHANPDLFCTFDAIPLMSSFYYNEGGQWEEGVYLKVGEDCALYLQGVSWVNSDLGDLAEFDDKERVLPITVVFELRVPSTVRVEGTWVSPISGEVA